MFEYFKSKRLNILGLNFIFGDFYWLRRLLKKFQLGFQDFYCLKLEI
jgi:hypothetical protein